MKLSPRIVRLVSGAVAACLGVFGFYACAAHDKTIDPLVVDWSTHRKLPKLQGANDKKKRDDFKKIVRKHRGKIEKETQFCGYEDANKKKHFCDDVTDKDTAAVLRRIDIARVDSAETLEAGGDPNQTMDAVHVAQRIRFRSIANKTAFLNDPAIAD